MVHNLQNSITKFFAAAIFASATFAASSAVHGAGPSEVGLKKVDPVKTALEYMVKAGDSLGSIANSHNVNLTDLIETNNIEDPDRVNYGTKLIIPSGSKKAARKKRAPKKTRVRIEVPRGVTLSRIADVYGTTVKAIVKANKIKNPDMLKAGQRLLIPGAEKVLELVPPPPCYKPAVDIYRVRTDETKTLSLCYCNGKPNEKALEELSQMTGPVKKEMPFPLHGRLIKTLQKVATKFPGKRLEVISGQRVRKTKGHESYHNKGQALDFRVEGISNKKLTNFVRKLNNVGVGYYPNSVFIHMDVREKSAYWIDYSRPGEKSIYGRSNMTATEIELIREKRRNETLARVTKEENTKNSAPLKPATDVNDIAEKIVEAAVKTQEKALTSADVKTDTDTFKEAPSNQSAA